VISKSECPEAAGDPAQTFSGGMGIGGMRISRADNLAQQNERRVGELVSLQERIERNVLAVMPEFAIRHIENDSGIDLFPVCVAWQEHKLRVWINEFFDKPGAGNSIHFNFLASDPFHDLELFVAAWFWYAVVAAVLYGAHQIFTRLAAERIGEGLGGFVVEASAALSILIYLAVLWFAGRWNQKFSGAGFNYSLLTGVCVGAGTIAFFLLFQKGGPLSSVPAILAGGAAIMAIAGILFFREPPSWQRIIGVAFAIVGLFLLRK
jgi:bacterial/archaeal transporter family protein